MEDNKCRSTCIVGIGKINTSWDYMYSRSFYFWAEHTNDYKKLNKFKFCPECGHKIDWDKLEDK
jgi:hypothetical protein